jgi:DNA-binding MarR family transcriptional regulator
MGEARKSGRAVESIRQRVTPGEEARSFAPPLSVSLEPLLRAGSDREFRQLIYNLLSFSGLMLQARERFATSVGLTGPQYSMLVAISEARETTATQLAGQLNVSIPFVAAETGKLIRLGLIAKRPSDRDARSRLLSPTPLGAARIQALAPLRQHINNAIFHSLTGRDAATLHRIIARLLADAQRAMADEAAGATPCAPAAGATKPPRPARNPAGGISTPRSTRR